MKFLRKIMSWWKGAVAPGEGSREPKKSIRTTIPKQDWRRAFLRGPSNPADISFIKVYDAGHKSVPHLLGSPAGKPRPKLTYRGARRAVARRLSLDWRAVPRLGARSQRTGKLTVVVNPLAELRW